MTTQDNSDSGSQSTTVETDLASQLAEQAAQIAALRAELAQARAQRSLPPPTGAMGAAPDGAESPRVQAARAAAQSGDRTALLSYLRVRRQPAD